MNADMLNRGTEDRPLPLSLSLSLSLSLFTGGGERPLRPPLDPPLKTIIRVIYACVSISG
jgi:hypothetical protein